MSKLEELIKKKFPVDLKTKLLGDLEDEGILTLGRGEVISKKDMQANPGIYPVYSSSASGDGQIGSYGKYMFDDERITWSIDGGGKLFYRNNIKYSITNVGGWLKVDRPDILITKYLYYCLINQWMRKSFDYTHKAHPSIIRNEYIVPLPALAVQLEIVRIMDAYTELTAALTAALTAELKARKKQYENYRSQLLSFDDSPEMEWMDFEECCTLSRGDYVTKKDAQAGNIPVILGGLEPAYYIDRSNHSGRAIVVSRSGASAGYVSYWNEPIFVTDGFIVEAKENTNIRYLYLYFKSMQDVFHASKRGAGIPHITGKFISSLKIPVPSHAEQARIVSVLDRFDALCNDITTGLPAEIEARKQQYEYYRDILLTFPEARA